DPLGVVHVPPGDLGDVIWYRAGHRRALSPADPTDNDLRVPSDLRVALAPLVAQWTAGAVGPAHIMAALAAHFRGEYRYSLHVPRPPRRTDPVVDFVLARRAGHCEYFASALALTARIAGVHT